MAGLHHLESLARLSLAFTFAVLRTQSESIHRELLAVAVELMKPGDFAGDNSELGAVGSLNYSHTLQLMK